MIVYRMLSEPVHVMKEITNPDGTTQRQEIIERRGAYCSGTGMSFQTDFTHGYLANHPCTDYSVLHQIELEWRIRSPDALVHCFQTWAECRRWFGDWGRHAINKYDEWGWELRAYTVDKDWVRRMDHTQSVAKLSEMKKSVILPFTSLLSQKVPQEAKQMT